MEPQPWSDAMAELGSGDAFVGNINVGAFDGYWAHVMNSWRDSVMGRSVMSYGFSGVLVFCLLGLDELSFAHVFTIYPKCWMFLPAFDSIISGKRGSVYLFLAGRFPLPRQGLSPFRS